MVGRQNDPLGRRADAKVVAGSKLLSTTTAVDFVPDMLELKMLAEMGWDAALDLLSTS